jgi:hypothetical protein
MRTETMEPRPLDVRLARLAVEWDDEADDSIAGLFETDDPSSFSGGRDDLEAIRSSIERYVDTGPDRLEDEVFFRARFRLQFVRR